MTIAYLGRRQDTTQEPKPARSRADNLVQGYAENLVLQHFARHGICWTG